MHIKYTSLIYIYFANLQYKDQNIIMNKTNA